MVYALNNLMKFYVKKNNNQPTEQKSNEDSFPPKRWNKNKTEPTQHRFLFIALNSHQL